MNICTEPALAGPPALALGTTYIFFHPMFPVFLMGTDGFPFTKSDLQGHKPWTLLLNSDCLLCSVLFPRLLFPTGLGAPQGSEGVLSRCPHSTDCIAVPAWSVGFASVILM